jgi:general secretion pathway protein B
MSYILEALKKSQQERELGHVPTLESSSFLSGEAGARPSPWALVAVILAGLAVIIALYSAFRGDPPIPEPAESVSDRARSAIKLEDTTNSPSPSAPADAEPEPDTAASSREANSSSLPGKEASADSQHTVIVAAPAAPAPLPVEATETETPPASPEETKGTRIPQDLVSDIEAFKRDVLAERSGKPRPEVKSKKTRPQDLRLPKKVRESMPEFDMSAHIYDKEPAKRFVLINGLKTREGEESREEITVEEILPDGAILRFEGNRFFQPR